ncbi:unnamed protein product [Haemonchus placei]|uniref:UDENN FLCN/SMCR8-type domain-containing protein n=1 Tax=Haemonchus placei TaxID=6290 RepID=A0A0N4W7K6_HAEPC|nr:unnamed protein product [Haemonchus placei]
MQAVIALCHFCENHGPRVMMITQPMRSLPSASSSSVSLIEFDQISPGTDGEHDGPIYYGDCTPEILEDPEERCNACTSFGNINQPCLLSNDHENKTSYISTQIPLKERVYERVRNACLRSLSCEISAPRKGTPSPLRQVLSKSTSSRIMHKIMSAYRLSSVRVNPMRWDGTAADDADESGGNDVDGSVFFGDADNGYCFSLTFRLRDSKARGFHRLYSFIVVSNDMTYIIQNYEFFLQALTAMKEKLQVSCGRAYSHFFMYKKKFVFVIFLRSAQVLLGSLPEISVCKCVCVSLQRKLRLKIEFDQRLRHLLHSTSARFIHVACRDR